MPRYNHLFAITYTVDSDLEDGADVTDSMHAEALQSRIADVLNHEGFAAVVLPLDTVENGGAAPAGEETPTNFVICCKTDRGLQPVAPPGESEVQLCTLEEARALRDEVNRLAYSEVVIGRIEPTGDTK